MADNQAASYALSYASTFGEGMMLLSGNRFDIIDFPRFKVFFDLGPLDDRRGIGRVGREVLVALKKVAARELCRTPPKTAIYFFPSIHWCPEILPDRSVVMIHDTIPLSLRYFFHAAQDQWLYDFSNVAGQADRILTISQSSKNDITKHLLIPAEKISVVYNGVADLKCEGEAPALDLPIIPFVTYLGAGDPHKNIDVILNALSLNPGNDLALVVIGQACDDILDRARVWGVDPELIFPLGRLSDSAAAAVLLKSIALVMPSLHEGFGLPPLEAGLLGVPSICSDRPALNEFMVDAAILVDPFLPREWLNAIRRLQYDRGLAERVAAAAEAKARSLTWELNANALVRIFENLAEEQP